MACRLPARSRRWTAAMAILVTVAPAACVSTKAPEQTGTLRAYDISASARRSRIAAQNFSGRFAGLIEETADSIMRASRDPAVQYSALEWKANAIPELHRSVFQSDPLVSFVDGWTFLVEMRQYFETGRGATRFGDQQSVATDMLRSAEAHIDSATAASLPADEHARLRTFVYNWADAHPLTNDLFQRMSAGVFAAEQLAKDRPEGFGQLGTLTEFAADAQQMSVVLATYLPREVRWQSELLIGSLADTTRLSPVLAAVDSMAVLRAVTVLLERTPELIAEERAALFREISSERLAILENLERQRIATLQAAVDLINAERAATVQQLAEIVARERSALTAEIAANRDAIMEQTRGLVDHIVIRTLQVGLGVLLVAGCALLLVFRIRRPRTA